LKEEQKPRTLEQWVNFWRYKIGLNVIPCFPKSKVAAIEWKEYQNKKYEDKILLGYNLAIVCGKVSNRLVVIDIDSPEIFDELFPEKEQLLQETIVIQTGSGKYHIYFRINSDLPKTMRLKNTKSQRIDIQSEGSYVISPPSLHPDTEKEYRIISSANTIKEDDLTNIFQRLKELGFEQNSKKGIDEILNGVEEGNRNNAAFKYSCFLIQNKKLPRETAWYELQKWNREDNKPALDTQELKRTFQSALSYGVPDESAFVFMNGSPSLVGHNKTHTEYANEIMEDFHFKTLDDTEEILVYKNGVYVGGGEITIKKECEKRIPKCFTHMVREVIKAIQRRTYCSREEFDEDPDVINLQNGLLSIKKGKVSPHDPNYLCRIQLPVKYNPHAKPIKIIKSLLEWLPDPKDRITILELSSLVLLPNLNLEKISMNVGGGSNGKSTYFKFFGGMLGKQNVSHVSIHDLICNRFAKAELDGKLANIFSDISINELSQLGVLKDLVSGDPVTAEKKGKDLFQLYSKAKMFFSTNQLPEIGEDSNAVYRRFIIVEWNEQFIGDKLNPQLLSELSTEEEFSGFLNILLFHGRKLLKKCKLTYEQKIEQLRKEMKERADPVRLFANTCLKRGVNEKTSKSEVYRIYRNWCDENNHIPKSERAFNSKLQQVISIEGTTYKGLEGGYIE